VVLVVAVTVDARQLLDNQVLQILVVVGVVEQTLTPPLLVELEDLV
jgi:hypothetical protein